MKLHAPAAEFQLHTVNPKHSLYKRTVLEEEEAVVRAPV